MFFSTAMLLLAVLMVFAGAKALSSGCRRDVEAPALICAACDAEVSGAGTNEANACRSCGASLEGIRIRMIDVRTSRRPRWIAVGVLLIVFSIVPAGMWSFEAILGGRWIEHRSFSSILDGCVDPGAAQFDRRRDLDELGRRWVEGELTAQQRHDVALAVLDAQQGTDIGMIPEHEFEEFVPFFEMAVAEGLVSDAEVRQFVSDSIVPRLVTRRQVRPGDPLAMELRLEWRGTDKQTDDLPSQSEFMSSHRDFEVVEVQVGDTVLTVPGIMRTRMRVGDEIVYSYENGFGTILQTKDFPIVELQPGTYPVKVTFRSEWTALSSLRGRSRQEIEDRGWPVVREFTLTSEVEVIQGTPVTLTRNPADIAEFRQFGRMFRVGSSPGLRRREQLRIGNWSSPTVSPDAGIAADAFVVHEGRRVHLGQLILLSDPRSFERGRQLDVPPQFAGQNILRTGEPLILVPSLDVAMMSPHLEHIYMGPPIHIVIEE